MTESHVNATTAGAQTRPYVAVLAGGDYAVTWTTDATVWTRLFDHDGTALTGDVQVNTTTGAVSGGTITRAGTGTVVTWFAHDDINAQRFDSSGAAIGSEFRVNTVASTGTERHESTSLSDGTFVVAWEKYDSSVGHWRIVAQRFLADGTAQGEFWVSADTSIHHMYVDTHALSDGGVLFAWSAAGALNYRLFDANGTPRAAAQAATGAVGGEHVATVVLNDGGFVVAWTQSGDSLVGTDIYARRFDSSGTAQGAAFRVNSITTGPQDMADLVALDDGGFLVVWDSALGTPHASARRYDADGNAQGAQFRLSESDGYQLHPTVDSFDGAAIVTWMGQWSGSSDSEIIANPLDTFATVEEEPSATPTDVQVNSTTSGEQTDPAVTVLENGGFAVAWSSNGEVFGRVFDAAGDPITAEFQVNTLAGGTQTAGTITRAGSGFVVTWNSTDNNLYGQRYDADGDALGSQFRINDALANIRHGSATLADGSFVITFEKWNPTTARGHIAAERFLADGTATGEFWVSDSHAFHYGPDVQGLADGGYVVAWNNGLFRLFDADGTPRSGELIYGYMGGIEYPSVATLANGEFVITWDAGNIYAQRFASDGRSVGPQVTVNTLAGSNQVPDVAALDDGGFIVTWQSGPGGVLNGVGQAHVQYAYARVFDASGNAHGDQIRISDVGYQQVPVVDSFDGTAVAAWTASWDGSSSYDIYATDLLFSVGLETQPNDTLATAEALTLDEDTRTLTTGSVSSAGDPNDYFSFVAPASGTVAINLYRPNFDGTNFRLIVYRADGTEVERAQGTDAGGPTIHIGVLSGLTYYARVDAASHDGDYSLGIGFASGDGNDSTEAASSLTVTQPTTTTVNATIGGADVADYFRVVASTSGILIATTVVPNAQVQGASAAVAMAVYDADGTLLAESTGSGANRSVSTEVVEGETYYVRAIGPATSTTYALSAHIDTPPALLAIAAGSGGSVVGVGADIVLTFDEDVSAGGGTIEIVSAGGSGSLGASSASTASISARDSSQVRFSGSTVTINPTSAFAPSTTYQVLIGNNAIVDSDGNALGATAALTFHTVAPVNGTANNSVASAQALSSSDGAAGALSTSDTVDYYTYTTSTAGLLTAHLSGLAANVDIMLTDSAGRTRAKGVNAGTADELLMTLVAAGETFLVRVSAAKGISSNYALDVDVDPLPAGEPTNNDAATPQILDASSTTTFTASVGATWGDKIDNYTFVAASSGLLTAGLSGMSGDLTLTVSDGVKPKKSANAGTADESVTMLVVAGHSYTVQVAPGKGVVSDYTLTLPISALPAGEPDNNALATAPTIDSTQTITASVGGTWGDTTDYYKFVAPISGVLTARMTGMTGDLNMVLTDSVGGKAKKSANAGTADETISTLVIAGQTYTVQVTPAKGVISDYTLTLPIQALPTGEPENNALATAVTIDPSTPFTASVGAGWGDTTDYYKFTAPISGVLTASLTGLTGDVNLTLTDGITKAKRSTNAGTADESISTLVIAGQTYTLQVTPAKGVVADYTLRLPIQALPAGEPENNAIATASTIDPNSSFTASVGAGWGDTADYYKFTAPTSGVLTVGLAGLTADLSLALYDAAGARLARSLNVGTANETVSFLVTAGSSYTVGITPPKGVVGDYTLTSSIASLPAGEPENNVMATAPTIASTTSFSANVGAGWGDKVDYYAFTAASTGLLSANLSGLSSNVDLIIYNAAGKAIVRGANLGTANEAVTTLVTGGEHYWVGLTPERGAPASDYTLAMDIGPAPAPLAMLSTPSSLDSGILS